MLLWTRGDRHAALSEERAGIVAALQELERRIPRG
jgi:hypothetical protein